RNCLHSLHRLHRHSDFDRAMGIEHGARHHCVRKSWRRKVLSVSVYHSVDQVTALLALPHAANRRNLFRFITSSARSFPFGVSNTFGILRKRGLRMIKRKASKPIRPLPMCSCRSTLEPRGVFESFT